KIVQLCNEFSLPYSESFVSIAVLGGNDDVHANGEYGIPLLLKIDDVLPLIRVICSDDIQNVADNKRGHEVLLEDCFSASLTEKMRMLADAVSKRSNARYAEARIYEVLRKAHVDHSLSPEENDPITQAGMWSGEEEEEIPMRSLTIEL